MSLEETKDKLELRKLAFEFEQKNSYGIVNNRAVLFLSVELLFFTRLISPALIGLIFAYLVPNSPRTLHSSE